MLGADAYTVALIERFGIPAVRGQLAANVEDYRADVVRMQREHTRRMMADALALAKAPAPSFRVALYSEEQQGWEAHRARYEQCLPGERVRPADKRRKQALAELAKLGMAVEYVNPNAAGDGD